MIVYRLGKTQYSRDLQGEGARLSGGRWNNPSTSCLYTAQSRALAILEYTVNVSFYDIPKSLSITVIEIADESIKLLENNDLPDDWNSIPASSSSKIFGSELLSKLEFGVFRVPSIVVSKEFNYILNPKHSSSVNFKILDVEDFIYDTRIKF